MKTNKYKLFILAFAFFSIIKANAQDIVLEENVDSAKVESNKGPNKKHYIYTKFGVAFIVGKNLEGSEIKFGNSSSIDFGIGYKRRFNNYLAWIGEIDFDMQSFALKQSANKQLPDTILHTQERIGVIGLAAQSYFRINFGKRGNYLGKYIDLGGYANYTFGNGTTHYTLDKYPNGSASGAKRIQKTESNLAYINTFQYGPAVRVGSNKFYLSAKYRLNPIINKDYMGKNWNDLPNLYLGFGKFF